MKTETLANRCPKCHEALPPNAPQGLCAKCLLAAAATPTEAGRSKLKESPPAIEAVATAFPQLDIMELIGQGGMGFVYKARQPKLDRFVALKLLPQQLAVDPAFAERFNREARVLARLNHPNIVTVHDFGQANSYFYLLMEFVDGVNLRQAMQAGRFTPEQAMLLVPKICEALQFAHEEGILHRDIKPENILLDTRGRVKIADFGIAKLVGEAREQLALTASGMVVGTPHYMAPEQLERPNEVDQRADIYSLGVVFYEMLTGELPLGRFEPPSKKSSVDPRVDDVVFHALEKEREKRFRSASEVKTSVEAIASSAPRFGQTATAGVESGVAHFSGEWRAACYFNTPKRMRDCFPSAAARVFTCKGELTLDGQQLTFVSPWRTTIQIPLKSIEDLSVGQFQMWSTPWVMKYARVNFLSITFRLEEKLQTVHLTPVPPDAGSASEINGSVGRWHQRIQQAIRDAAGVLPRISNPEWLAVSAEPVWNRKGLPLAYAFSLGVVAVWILAPYHRNFQGAWLLLLNISALLFMAMMWFCFAFLRANRAIWKGELEVVTSEDPPQAETATERPERPPSLSRGRPALLNSSFLGAIGVGLVIPIGIMLWEAWGKPNFGEKVFGKVPTAEGRGSKMVLDAFPTRAAQKEARKTPGRGEWYFKCLVPPRHQAHVLFVHWTKGVATIEQALSAYAKVGYAPAGMDLLVSCEPSELQTNSLMWNVNFGLGYTTGMLLPAVPGFQQHAPPARLTVLSGRQLVIPMISSSQAAGPARLSDGVELRILLEPLTTPAMRTVPSEIQLETHVVGAGLDKPMADVLKILKEVPSKL